MNSHHKQQTDLPYECLIENHIEHLMSEYDRLSTDDACPQLWLLVRRQSFWDSELVHLREALARLLGDVKRPADDAASVDW